MPGLLVWLLAIGLMFIGFGLLGGSVLSVQKRPHFWWRVLLQCLAMVAAVLALFAAAQSKLVSERALMLFWLGLVVGALVLAPVSCFRSAGPPPGPADDGGDGGTDRPPPPPNEPLGGVPLLDAEQSTTRVRDHGRPQFRHRRPRRRAKEPARAPTLPN
jgi:hypothetical protein